MVPDAWQRFINLLRVEVQEGRVQMSRIDDATERILTAKFALGLFERPLADRSYLSTVGSAEHRALARQAVRQSQVLLKNDNNVLPLPVENARIFVAGKNADDIGHQSGGWTIRWQGGSGPITPGTTILEGIQQAAAPSSTITFSADGSDIDSSYDVAVAVIGETPYAEGFGDRPAGMGLDATDLATLATLRGAGVPVVVVLVSGRPLDIADQLPQWDALVAAWLPGTEGQGVADVLFGAVAPTGALPVTWMQSASQLPINDGDGQTPLFRYGFGLTYDDEPEPTLSPHPGALPHAQHTGGELPRRLPHQRLEQRLHRRRDRDQHRRCAGNRLGARVQLPAGQQLTHGWSAVWSQQGAQVTATNQPWNGTLPAGAGVEIGFNGSHGGDNPPPTAFTLNGSPCTS